YILTCVVVFFISLKASRLYAVAMGKDPGGAPVTSIVLALQAWFCCGALGYVILQSRLSSELKKYNLRVGFMGPKKQDVEAVIAQMQAVPPPPTGFMPGPPP